MSFLKPMGQERAARRAPHHSCAIRQTPQAIPTTPIPTTRPFGPASYPPRPVAAFAATKAPAHIHFQPLTKWRERALEGAASALKERERDERDDEIARLKSKVGEITMDNELLYAKIAAMEGKRPLARRRPRR